MNNPESGLIADTVKAGARIALAIIKEWIAPADLELCRNGSSHPDDFCDSNIALYGAYAAIHFAESDADGAEWLNRVSVELERLLKS